MTSSNRIGLLAVLALLPLAGPALASAPDLSDAAGSYAISQDGSNIRFAIGQIDGGGLQGNFGQFSGTIRIDAEDLTKSKVDLTIVPDSVATGKDRVDSFLRSDAVFDSANEKAIVFHSATIRQDGPEAATVVGRLTARGKSANETFHVTLEKFAGQSATFHVTGQVYRSRYGMDVGTPIFSNVVDFDMEFLARRR